MANIDVRKKGNVCVLEIAGPLTLGKGEIALRQTFRRLIEDGDRYFVLDMSAVSQLDSAGIGETVACYKRACERNGIIKIAVLPGGRVRQLFKLSSLDQLFEVFDDAKSAIATF